MIYRLLISCLLIFVNKLFVVFSFGEGAGHGGTGVNCHNFWNEISLENFFVFFFGGGRVGTCREGLGSAHLNFEIKYHL